MSELSPSSMKNPLNTRPAAGFSLVELTIVVVILGVLSMMAVPRYHASVEGSKAAEAYVYMKHIRGAQERHQARRGEFARRVSDLDIRLQPPQHFSVGDFSSYSWQTQWQLRLTRDGASSGYGAYTVTFNQDGFVSAKSSIPAEVAPDGVGGKVSSSGASRGSTAPVAPIAGPTGALEWDPDEPLDFEEYKSRIWQANEYDYEIGDDPYLDLMLRYMNWLNKIFYGVDQSLEDYTEEFLENDEDDYVEGENWLLDFFLGWHFRILTRKNGW
jgi:type IV pilus assembly protein PilA